MTMLSPSIFGKTVDLIIPALIALIVTMNKHIEIKITVNGLFIEKLSAGT